MPTHQSISLRSVWQFFVTTAAFLPLVACQSTNFTEQGALLGGLTGAGVGAAIGDSQGNTAAGAAVGTAFGALTGATIGNGLDTVEANNQALIERNLSARQTSHTAMNDAITMTRAGLSDQVIIQQINSQGIVGGLSTADLIGLKNEGVSDSVIRTMQAASTTPGSLPNPSPRRVYLEEYYAYPCLPPYRPRWHHWHAPHRRPRVSWGVSLGH
ncbi:MAG: glycine zipper domain-containing protein [Pirellulaceae bacterium]|nr:glycine zipper domain-containing protein [Pirellulaceae bacterium]